MPILTDDMKRVVREQALGFYATVCPDGTPNVSPKGTTAVWDDDHLVFVDLFSPGTMANLLTNPAIEVNIVDPITRTGYRFKGRAEVHVDDALFEEVVAYYARERELARTRVKGIAMIAVESVAPLISPSYDLGMTRDEIVNRSLRRLEVLHSLRIKSIDDD